MIGASEHYDMLSMRFEHLDIRRALKQEQSKATPIDEVEDAARQSLVYL